MYLGVKQHSIIFFQVALAHSKHCSRRTVFMFHLVILKQN